MGYSGIDTLLTTLYSFIKKIHLLSQKKNNSNSDQIDGRTSQYIHLVHKYSRNEKKKQKQKDLITFPPGKLILE